MKAASIESESQRYLNLPYTRELVREDDGSWFARILEFPGCMTVGDSREEALEMLDDAMIAWVEAKLEDQDTIPAPMIAEEFSGRFVVRVSKALHRDLVRAAERNGVSLNQYVVTMLAQSSPLTARDAPQTSSIKFAKRSGLGSRRRDLDGEIRAKRGDTLIGTLREQYGADFAPGVRGNMRLDTYLNRFGADSLQQSRKRR